MTDAGTDSAVARSKEVAGWLAAELNDLPVDATLRNRMAGGCLSVSQDHHSAIVLLLEVRLYASAFALVRIQYDAYVRGLWLSMCATDDEVSAYANGNEPKKMTNMGAMLAELEAVEAYESGQLSKFKAEGWSAMCSYTHTGGLQVQRWQTPQAIEPNYPPEEICEVANVCGAFSLLAGVGIAALAKNDALALRLLEKMKVFAANP